VKCKATTKAGNPCQANAVAGSDYCISHKRLFEAAEASANPKADAPQPDPPVAANPPETPKSKEPDYVQSQAQKDSQPRVKEGTAVDEKKNVGFIPGLALILAALALVLISINAVKPTPTVEELEKSIDTRFAAVNDSLLQIVKSSDVVNRKVNEALFLRDLDSLRETLNDLKATADPTFAAELEAVAASLNALKDKVGSKNGDKPAPAKKEEKPKDVQPL